MKKRPIGKFTKIGYLLIVAGCLIGLLKYRYEDGTRRKIELVECGFLIAGGVVVLVGYNKRRKEREMDKE